MRSKTTQALDSATTEAAAIVSLAEAAESAQRPIVHSNSGGVPRLFVPEGYTVKDLESELPRPQRLRGTVNLTSMASFIAYVKQYKGSREVAVYKNEADNTVTAVFDHHSATETGWGSHRAVVKMTPDTRFSGWLGLNGKTLSQMEFADFLEDHLSEIRDPNASELLEIITDLKVKTGISSQHTKNLRNGNISLVWEENSTESREVPARFTVQVPVFSTSVLAYEFTARLRYRFKERQLVWVFLIDRLVELKRASWNREIAALEELTGVCPVFDGVPVPAATAA